jgi:hypothetical protein
MSYDNTHHDWLSLIEISGPFLAVPVLKEAFPQGLEELDATKRKRLRQAYEEWREALELEDGQFAELHVAWIDEVLSRGLELDEDGKGDVLKRADWCAANLQTSLPEHGITLSPDLAVIDEQRANKPLLLIQTYTQDIDLDATLKQDGWAATPADRMVQLCRSLGCRHGLVTNGERWMLVDAPVGAVTTFASWYASIWSQEPITLQAFVHLLGIRRFFVDESEQLPALFDRSLKFQDEVTDALGEQVRRAVEVLIQTLDKADQDRNRELLHDVKEPELYEAALTVMMRLVFLLSAEERGLLLMGDERYEANYALSTLRMQLRKESEEILERRWDAWSRLLAIFRAVFGGIEHENLRLPALGGSLFDPDRFPFLEGRAKGSSWRTDAATPLPIDNRTVLLLLEAIQQFQGRTLSYRALDVEQIGYVYEGLLERTVKRTIEVTLELDATKSAKTPWVKLAELDSARLDGAARLAELLHERSGSSVSRVRNDLAKPVDDTLADRLLTACQGDTKLRDRVKPYAHLLRTDPWGYPLVYPAGAFIVTTGSDRRETGTHYTPKSLTEAIVAETLTPVAYVGPAEGTPRDRWALKSPAELLDLKICDPAMGSGAFLVQACRWLSDRLVEAWSQVEATGKTVSVDGEVLNAGAAKEPLPRDSETRTVIARRLIAERCLYGVDLNPLAVELAKLSIWLVTLAKGRPFGFLDHNLRCGDSLLGIHRLDQLTELSMTPSGKGQQRLFGQNIEMAVREAIELRTCLREMPIRDIRDIEAMAQLNADARQKIEVPERIADAFIGEVFVMGGTGAALENALASLSIQAGQAIEGDQDSRAAMRRRADAALATDLIVGKPVRRLIHWPLEFPEVFARPCSGFDALVGNPPFLGGRKIRGALGGDYLNYLVNCYGERASGNADLCAFFFLRSYDLCSSLGACGFIATNTIAEGDTRKTGLEYLLGRGARIFYAEDDFPWPGTAAVTIAIVHFTKCGSKIRCRLGGNYVDHITASLRTEAIAEKALPIQGNSELCFQGSVLAAKGFILNPLQANRLIADDPKNKDVIFPYFTGDEIFNSAVLQPSRYVINFFDWPLARARQYRAPLEIIEHEVMPVRAKVSRKAHRDYWWHYGDKRPALYKLLDTLPRAIVQTRHTKYLCPQFVPTGAVFSESTVVFPSNDYWLYAVLNSSIHESWARENSGSIGTGLRYTHTDCFYTYPLPVPEQRVALVAAGKELETERGQYRAARECSVNEMMDAVHDPSQGPRGEDRLRKLHVLLDLSMARAYGWNDLDLGYGFHEVPYLPENDRVRFTISEAARIDVLRRLSELNWQRHEEEVSAGLHSDTTPRKTKNAPEGQSAPKKTGASTVQAGFDFKDSSSKGSSAPSASANNQWGDKAPDQILAWLEAHTGWFTKQAILTGCGAESGAWDNALAELLSDEFIETHADGNRWRARP